MFLQAWILKSRLDICSMIDFTYAEYDDYLEPKEIKEDDRDFYEDFLIEKELKKMKRNIIDLTCTDITFEEAMQLENYVWQGNLLIPEEKIGE